MTEPIELYIHIPFCVRKCNYCDFLSFPCLVREIPQTDNGTEAAYLEALKKEILCRGNRQSVRSVFFGGGTPSLVSVFQIKEIMELLRSSFSIEEDCEITIECNPGTVTREKALAWKEMGINRVSMGVQSFDNRLLKRLGRIHNAQDGSDSFRCLRECGFQNLSIDLMMGLPEQNIEDYMDTLQKAVNLKPEHLSCYSLIVEEGTSFYEEMEKGTLILPSDEEEREMYHQTLSFLKANGYEQYEISNFAAPGFQSRHNLGYWERIPYLGLGLGASSFIKEDGAEIRFKNTSDINFYIRSQGTPSFIETEKEVLTIDDCREEFMFLGLRKTKGVSKEDFENYFGIPFDSVYSGPVAKNIKKGLLEEVRCPEDGKHYLRLTPLGLDLGNEVFSSFLKA